MVIIMRKTFTLDEIDCANCAAKLEAALNRIDGVDKATVNFFAQKLIIEANDERFDDVLKNVLDVCKKMHPECTVKL